MVKHLQSTSIKNESADGGFRLRSITIRNPHSIGYEVSAVLTGLHADVSR